MRIKEFKDELQSRPFASVSAGSSFLYCGGVEIPLKIPQGQRGINANIRNNCSLTRIIFDPDYFG